MFLKISEFQRFSLKLAIYFTEIVQINFLVSPDRLTRTQHLIRFTQAVPVLLH